MLSVLLSFSLFLGTLAGTTEENLSMEFCKQFPSLHLCRLHDTLQGSLVELQYLLHDSEGASAVVAGLESGGIMQKRKSAFVRFGKRSAGEEETETLDMEKRKSAFVRFGRSDPAELEKNQEKRKSQYVRFGRK